MLGYAGADAGKSFRFLRVVLDDLRLPARADGPDILYTDHTKR